MNNIAKYTVLATVAFSLCACDDLFTPAIENIRNEESTHSEATFAEGILGSSYILLPYSNQPYNDVATDDAVSNDIDNTYLAMATGSWTSQTGVSGDNWRNRNASVQYCNVFLRNVDDVKWAASPSAQASFVMRLKGEAFALRALNLFFMLQNYGGKGAISGELLGVPIWTTPYDATVDMNLQRNTFAECLKQINEDLDSAIAYLPYEYGDVAKDADVPAKYRALGANAEDYTRACGSAKFGRVSGRIAEAFRAQAQLLAASPAFQASGATWAQAADAAAVVIDHNNGIAGISETGHKWFLPNEIDLNASTDRNHPEVLWSSGKDQNATLEGDNFPPSLYGKGRINPTQNLVDAFPAINGYPIKDSRSQYDPANPYENRDPRLALYIVYNGAKQGVNSSVINTSETSDNNDGINKESGYSTRTGYYMRKHLRDDCNPNSTNKNEKDHYTAYIRYTEIYLDYAEAANEAWGPKSGGSHAYSAYDVIKAIRKRAGIGLDNGDAYLESCAASKEAMRELIRNERRIELCFENFRFWDLRRWQAPLNETAKGAFINGTSYNYKDVEPRKYQDYMIYGPLPYEDVLKLSNLEQNMGW